MAIPKAYQTQNQQSHFKKKPEWEDDDIDDFDSMDEWQPREQTERLMNLDKKKKYI